MIHLRPGDDEAAVRRADARRLSAVCAPERRGPDCALCPRAKECAAVRTAA